MKLEMSAAWRGTAVLLGLIVLGHAARADEVSGVFIGGSVGRARIEANNALYQSQLESSIEGEGSLIFTKSSLSNRNTAWWADTGYMVWPYVGVEVSYLHFGKLRNQVAGSYTPTGGTSEYVYAATFLSSDGPAVGLLFRLPLIENLDINFRLADYYSHTTLTNPLIAGASVGTTKQTANGSSLLVGVGGAYTFAGHWSAKLDYLRVNQAGNSSTTMKYDVGMLSVGVSYTF